MTLSIDNIATIEASAQDGGWRASGSIFGDADRLTYYQEVTAQYRLYINNAWEGSLRTGFSGHIIPDTFSKTFQDSVLPYTAFTAQEFMKNGRVQGIWFQAEASPANAHQITDMTYADIVEHILGVSGEYGHSNLVEGVWPEGFMKLNIDKTNSVKPGVHEVKEGNYWSRLQEIATTEFYLLYVGKDNTLNYIPHPMFGTLPTAVMTIEADHILEPLRITPRNQEMIGQVRLAGTTPEGAFIEGKYPSDPTAGPIVSEGGFKASSNTLMNTVAERKYKFMNRDYSVNLQMNGVAGLLFELMDRVEITYASSVDGISWSGKKFWIHDVRVAFRDGFDAVTTLQLEAENA